MFGEQYEKSETFLIDNIIFLRNCPTNKFDVAIVDPEYLHQEDNYVDEKSLKGGRLVKKCASFRDFSGRPDEEYFYHLFRVSKHQFIFGGNYFTSILRPYDDEIRFAGTPYLEYNNNWFIWHKQIADAKWSMAELAWTSINCPMKVYKKIPMGDVANWHPTSKPLSVYRYIYKTYIERLCEKTGKRVSILDTNLGSGTSRQAAWEMKFPFTGLEINEKFFNLEKRDFDLYRQSKGFAIGQENEGFNLDSL